MYIVKGFSQVKNNVCTFSGKIYNIKYYEDKDYSYKEEHGYDNTYGYLTAEFILKKNAKEKASGVFEGVLWTHWMLKPDEKITLLSEGDSKCNNQFFGEWSSYTTGRIKTAAWGVYRITFTDELDNGANEFIPDKKYLNNGREDYKRYPY